MILTTYAREGGDGRWIPLVYVRGSGLYFWPLLSPHGAKEVSGCTNNGRWEGLKPCSQNPHFRSSEDTELQWAWEVCTVTLLQKLYNADPRSAFVWSWFFHHNGHTVPLYLGKARPFVFTVPPVPGAWWSPQYSKSLGLLGFCPMDV